MASLRSIKKDIDYLVNEVAHDSFLSMSYHEGKDEAFWDIIQDAVDVRNYLFEMVNNPAEKHNKSLVRKHYAYVRQEMFSKVDELFQKISATCKA